MIDNLKALECIAREGSITRAAKRLFISQPAMSKRIASLEAQLDQALLEKVGTGVRLTPYGVQLVQRASPLLRQLETLINEEQEEARGNIGVSVSSSIMLSWGARALRIVRERLPEVNILISSGITASSIDQVISGEITAALVPGFRRQSEDLVAEEVHRETFVIVPSQLKPFRLSGGKPVPLMCVPSHAETGSIIGAQLKSLNKQHGHQLEITSTLLHFFEIANAAKEGLGHGLVPLGVTKALSIPRGKLMRLPAPGIVSSSCMVVRRSSLALPVVKRFWAEMMAAAAKSISR